MDEAWLSEAKPSTEACWKKETVITESERQDLIRLQDRWNRRPGLTVNYLGHFEDGRHFGCTAGHKMVFIDPFGEVSPCVFIPMTFGNVREGSLRTLYGGMRSRFPAQDHCFVNTNYISGIIREESCPSAGRSLYRFWMKPGSGLSPDFSGCRIVMAVRGDDNRTDSTRGIGNAEASHV